MESNKQGICQLAIIPMRSEPSECSEQINQVLFGESFTILETKNNWSLIETQFDSYRGWITSKMATIINHKPDEAGNIVYLKDALGRIAFPGNMPQYQWIPGGASLYELGSEFTIYNQSFTFDPVCQIQSTNSKITLAETALKFLNAPYLWGGRTIFGIDCSGFTQIVYKMNGMAILRDAAQQSEQGSIISFVEEAKPGDLAFFDNEEGKIIHVGIILEKNKIIHASGQVRVDKLDHQGIYNEEIQKYTHKLRLIKRVYSHK
jgi:gamma-D-glutamyl-L-lysine dipeptidyl-peptidase